MTAQIVQRTAELERIRALPRRIWESTITPELVAALTKHLRTPAGTMTLRPVQAAALVEFHDNGGACVQAGVGKGKTLISLLAPTVVNSDRNLLIVPANLRDKTVREFRELSEHWQRRPMRIVSFNEISLHGDEILSSFAPEVVILDEAHKAKNPKAACTKRLKAYIKARRKAGLPLRVLAMTGTLSKRSLADFAHLLEWALPTGSPLPASNSSDLLDWCAAIDEKVEEYERAEPGALLGFCIKEDHDFDPVTAARRGVQRRIFETPGAMATRDNSIGCNLIVQVNEVTVPPAVDDAFKHIKTEWKTPDGWPISDGVTMWRHARELALGFYYKWDPRPPSDWLWARSEWCALVREILATNRHGLFSEGDVIREVEAAIKAEKHHIAIDKFQAWRSIAKTFEPNTVPVWIDDFALQYVAQWAKKNVGIVWVDHVAFARKLAKVTGLPYFGRQGQDDSGRDIYDADPTKSLIASIASNKEGRNLQAWNRALVTSWPPTGTACEQMLGRQHREGQKADEVIYEVMISSREQYSGFEQAMRDAHFHSHLLGSAMKLATETKKDTQIFLDEDVNARHADIVVPLFRAKGWAWREPVRKKQEAA